jgi:hypothetical protein
MICYWNLVFHHLRVSVKYNHHNNHSTILFFHEDVNGNNDTAPTTDTNTINDINDSNQNDARDLIVVMLAFLAVTGCFICTLLKCSNSWYVIRIFGDFLLY